MLSSNFGDLLIIAVVVVISIVLHELAHGYVAKWNGDYTAKYNGRLTLNPLSHFDLVGFLMLMMVGFGFAKPVPVNPNNFRKLKRGIFTVAIAGVTVNLILAFVSYGLWMVVVTFAPMTMFFEIILTFLSYMTLINLSLMFFNLLPIYPLDGFRVVEAFTRFNNPYCKFMRDYGQFLLIGLILISVVVGRLAMPAYFDLIGLYINTFVDWVLTAMSWFWGLIF